MVYTKQYTSPLGVITIACNEEAITGLWFDGQKYFGDILPGEVKPKEHPLLKEAGRWLDIYFSGQEPDFLPPLKYDSTGFDFFSRLCKRHALKLRSRDGHMAAASELFCHYLYIYIVNASCRYIYLLAHLCHHNRCLYAVYLQKAVGCLRPDNRR